MEKKILTHARPLSIELLLLSSCWNCRAIAFGASQPGCFYKSPSSHGQGQTRYQALGL